MADGKSTVGALLSDESFIRWAKGMADKQEARAWDEWCNRNESNRKLAIRAQNKLFEVTPAYLHQTDSEREWMLLLERIQDSPRNRPGHRDKTNSVVWWYRVAAALLVAAVVGVITYQVQIQQEAESVQEEEVVFRHIETDYGEQKTIKLSDGSSIILNAHSSLKYPAGWVRGESIKVQLQGEAYFDITKRMSDDDPAFEVQTLDGTVQVMGTRFVVDTREKRTRVGLEEGAVRIVKEKTTNTGGKELIQLKPDQLAEFSRFDESVEIQEVNSQTFTSWIRHVLVMDNTPFSDLTDRIRKTYGVNIKVNDQELYNRRLTGSVNMRSLDLLVKAISEVLEIDVRKSGDTVIFGS